MSVTRNEMKNEALARMRILKIHEIAVNDLEKNDMANVSFLGCGILYWPTDKQIELIKKFEDQYNCLVYHDISSTTEIGELLTLLYISQYESDWPTDREDLKNYDPRYGYSIMAYVYNLSNDIFSEFGSVCVKPKNGGLVRTA
jgi:hypothetical protein